MYKIEREQITELLMDLVNIDSPYFEEDKIMKYVHDWFRKNKMDASIHEYHELKVTGFREKYCC